MILKVEKKLDGLVNLKKELARKADVQVGFFSAKSSREAQGMKKRLGGHWTKAGTSTTVTNPQLAAIHELGSVEMGIPPRSILKMPINLQRGTIMEMAKAGALQLIAAGRIDVFWKRVGIACETVVSRAFDTGGYGRWAKLKEATMQRKGSSAILIDTSQLWRAVASRVRALA